MATMVRVVVRGWFRRGAGQRPVGLCMKQGSSQCNAHPSSMRRPDAGVAVEDEGAATLVMVVLPAPAPRTVLMTLSYSLRSVALVASCAAVAPAAGLVVRSLDTVCRTVRQGPRRAAAAEKCAMTPKPPGLCFCSGPKRRMLLIEPSQPQGAVGTAVSLVQ